MRDKRIVARSAAFDSISGKHLVTYDAQAVAMSRDGTRLCTCEYKPDRAPWLQMRDAESGKLLYAIALGEQAAFSTDGRRFAMASGDVGEPIVTIWADIK